MKKISVCAAALLLAIYAPPIRTFNVHATDCKDIELVFARGSGETRNTDQSFLEFKSTLEEKLKTTRLGYDFIDLDYPAISVSDPSVMLGAFFSGGGSFAFGDSVSAGVNNLTNLVNDSACPNTKYVLAGYSQGAMVVINSLNKIAADKIIYAATFGDPKLYLPEGGGLFPAACMNMNLSNYRVYVPDCYAHNGLLGGTNPYQAADYFDKLGTWCNKMDIMCSSHFNLSHHVSYVADDLYADAARIIFSKITKSFGITSNIASPHDTAILLDTTGSMGPLIFKYKNEAVRLATETFNAGGRVALFEYRDLDDPFSPVEHCNFENCTIEKFISAIDNIEVTGGGDEPESLLSASLHVMHNLKWQRGSTKSLVVLTDAGFHAPDRDGATIEQVIKLSREIDPVNFYIITPKENLEKYTYLATATDGKVITNFDELSLLTDFIIERSDSLPKVEPEETEYIKPSLKIKNVSRLTADSFKISLESSSGKTLIILNDAVLGITTENTFTITDIDTTRENVLSLIPITNEARGDAVIIKLDLPEPEPEPEPKPEAEPEPEPEPGRDAASEPEQEPELASEPTPEPEPVQIKAPNTGFKPKIML